MEKLLTVQEVAAKYLSVHPNTIYRKVRNGEIPFIKIKGLGTRFRQKEIDTWLDQGSFKPSQISSLLPKPKPLDIPLDEYDRLYLKGDSAVAEKRQRWCFGRKGVFKRKLKSGFSWCYWYYDEKNKLKKVTDQEATCRADTITAMDAKVEEVRKKKLNVKSITFGKFAPIYLEKYAKQKKESYETDAKFIYGRLVPHFGDMLLSEITCEHVSDFIANFKPKKNYLEKVKGSTINKHLQVLSRMFTIAEKFGYETCDNPVDRELHFLDETPYRRKRILTYKEEERLMSKAAKHLRPIIQCALLQGMRLKEILWLRICDVALDSEPATITIRPENNKTKKEDIIPIRPRMKRIFKQLINENSGRSEFMFNYFDPSTKKYRNITICRRAFKAACRRAGIMALQFRDLRKTCSQRMHEAHIDPLLIQRFLRHTSFRMTGRVYIQSSLKMMLEAFKEVDTGLEQKPNWNTIRTYLEHETRSKKTGKEVKCLFSTN